MKETELYEPVKQFLLNQGCSEVYAEVGTYDVLGIQSACNIIVEMKTTLNFKVIDQALYAVGDAEYVYIAVPYRKASIPSSVNFILTQNKIGLLYVKDDEVSIQIPARFQHVRRKRNRGKPIRHLIKEYQHELIGGSKSGENKTDYSVMISQIKTYLQYSRRSKWTPIEEILDKCEIYYANPRPSVIATLRADWNKDWVESRKVGRKIEFRYKGDDKADE